MPTVLITGTNRGLGLALAIGYAAMPDIHVVAVSREGADSYELSRLAEHSGGRVGLVRADVADAKSIEHLVHEVGDTSIDLLINNAGVAGSSEFGEISVQDLIDVFRVNAFAALLVTQALRSRLAQGGKVVNITSVLGSIDGGCERADALTYSMSKAALNMFSVKLATVLRPRGIAVLAMHPGGVRTHMGGNSAPLSADTSAEGMMRVIGALNMEHTGAFLAYDGSVIPW